MTRKKPECPICRDKGDVDAKLKCGVCGKQLEYAEADGTLRVVEGERKCPRCNTINSKDVKHCENCGAQIAKFCDYCKAYHFIEDRVCPKTGEPIKAATAMPESSSPMSKVALVVSILMILLFGALMMKTGRKTPDAKPVPPDSTSVLVVGANGQPHIDVVFVVDATGSMGDEIGVVKNKIRDMVATIANGQPKPYVRYGIVAYRDRGDAFITKKYELTDNTQIVQGNINQLQADGGGDTPESVNEALHVAINEMNWDRSANTRKMVFLIGDAGPHTNYSNDYDYRKVAHQAKERGIKISTIGCSGITSSGEKEFKEIASLTGGQFDYLTYQQAYRKSDGSMVHVLSAGEKKYVVDDTADKDEWKEGYRTMVKRSKAKVARDEELSKMAPAPAASGKSLKNNLDQVLVQQVQMEAEGMGVKYKK